ncbi:uncharacterized protein K441DRAFT_567257, partial [Cenococcum geophilum 1.58]
YYYISCIKYIFSNLPTLIKTGHLKIEGGITPSRLRNAIKIKRFHKAIKG